MRFLILVGLLCWQSAGSADPYPEPETFAAEVRRALTRGFDAQQNFTYLERRREVDISVLGKVTVGPLRTFEVFPPDEAGQVRKRLIEIDGKPLDQEELARRDAEHERNLRQAAERRRRETARQRAARRKEQEEERRKREAILDDAIAVFEPTFVGRETIDGHPVWVVDISPHPDPEVRTREGRWMRHFKGRIWVSESDYQVVKLDMHAFGDLTVGWGVVGRLNAGSRVTYRRQRLHGVWLPVELSYKASGRTLLVRPFEILATTTYSNYRPAR